MSRSLVLCVCLAAAALLLPASSGFAPASRAQAGRGAQAKSAAIRTTPPAPTFDDAERRAELAARRSHVAREVGPAGVLVLFSAEPRVYTGDIEYKYRQENNLFYLTHLKQRGATLVLIPGNPRLREILFLPRRNPTTEAWNGAMYSPEEARRLSGVGEIWDAREFAPFMQALAKRQAYRPRPENVLLSESRVDDTLRANENRAAGESKAAPANSPTDSRAVAPSPVTAQSASPLPVAPQATAPAPAAQNPAPGGFESLFAAAARNEAALYLLVPVRDADTGEFGDAREWRREQRYAEQWAKSESGFRVRSAFPIFTEMRVRKSPSEIRRLLHAIDITTEAVERAMSAAGGARWEYEVEAEVDYVFRLRNADGRGYPSIVGCGPDATTIHYEESQGRVAPGELLLLDVGAEFDHYTADITRTFPVGGLFTPAQADIYQIVLAAQDAGIAAARPGATLADVHNAALNVIKDGLLRLGLITDRNSAQHARWFPHFTSHWLGMNVHDIGYGNVRLEPGMVFTVEPGIYVRPDALERLADSKEDAKFAAAVRPAFEKYKNIGVRIEDDILITPDGARVLSEALPRTIPDIEAFVQRNAQR